MAEDLNTGFRPEDFGLADEGAEGEAPAAEAPPAEAAGGGGGGQTAAQKDDESLRNLDISRMKMVLDVPLKVTVELGRTKLLVNDLLQLGQGSVIELDKMAGEPMEIYVNDKLVAMGEVVVVNEKFGVRLTDVMSGVGMEASSSGDSV
ncbi:flagellar motor switch protein FliN [Fluviispira multicolorata]|uniref:Flagellar motor switch protein FliN n=1 Tax=Fluviispira multicolorata TaxID=2654512 RepID=A0A833N4F4_9BACT|nr:flagellar motor switch protein FliN [Fluviispira multicolorata]KAB8027720.1 flagellar motor switch protein FliN [Fluviispira multicolorata]